VNTVRINQRRSNEELEALVTKLEQQVVLLKEHVKKLESELGRTVTVCVTCIFKCESSNIPWSLHPLHK
jgi:uncharacterized FlaG/YvyC family protein